MEQPAPRTKRVFLHASLPGPAGSRGASRQAGFSLVELVIVIVLIGVLAVVATPRFDYTGPQAAAVSRKLIEDLRYAQSLAISTQIRHGLVFSNCGGPGTGCTQYQIAEFDLNWEQASFDANGNSQTKCYQSDQDQIQVDCGQVLDPLTGQPMIVQMTDTMQGVTLNTTLENQTIQFDASGRPWADHGTSHKWLQESPSPDNTIDIHAGTCVAHLTVAVTTGLVGTPVTIAGTTTPEVQCS